jgi:hypothetical protein
MGRVMRPDGHAQTEAAFRAALWSQDVPAGLTAPDPTEVPRRFAVYRNNVSVGLNRALAACFPAVERLVGAEFMAAAGRVFAAAHPPRTAVLQDWGAEYPAWLAGFAPVAHLPWLADVARLEWLRGRAVHAADAAPADPAALAAVDPAALRLRLHPSVAGFASAHPAVAIWAAQQPGATAGPIPPGPSRALIARRPDFAILTEPLSEPEHATLVALLQGTALGTAAAGDPTRLLTLLLTHGLIAAIETE